MTEIGAKRTSARNDVSSEPLIRIHEELLPNFLKAAHDESRPTFEGTYRIDNHQTKIAEQAVSLKDGIPLLHIVDVSACYLKSIKGTKKNKHANSCLPDFGIFESNYRVIGNYISFNNETIEASGGFIPAVTLIPAEDQGYSVVKSRISQPKIIPRDDEQTRYPEIVQAVRNISRHKIGKLSVMRMVERSLVDEITDRVIQNYMDTPFVLTNDASGFSRFHRPLRVDTDFYNNLMICADLENNYEDMLRLSGRFEKDGIRVMNSTIAFVNKNYEKLQEKDFHEVCAYWESPSEEAVGAFEYLYSRSNNVADRKLGKDKAEEIIITAAQKWKRERQNNVLDGLRADMPMRLIYKSVMSSFNGRIR